MGEYSRCNIVYIIYCYMTYVPQNLVTANNTIDYLTFSVGQESGVA